MDKATKRRNIKNKRYANGLCVYCGNLPHLKDKKGCSRCLNKKYKIHKKYVDNNKFRVHVYKKKIRKDVIDKYGGKCMCCGEKKWEFLTIDHINNDGNKERKEKYGSSSGKSGSWYLKLKREAKRKDLQILCFNCNLAKSICGGVCPHDSDYQPIDFSILNIDHRRDSKYNIGCKIIWPSNNILIKVINKYNCEVIAKIIGVHGVSIRERLKRRNLYHLVKNKSGKKIKKVDKKTIQRLLFK